VAKSEHLSERVTELEAQLERTHDVADEIVEL